MVSHLLITIRNGVGITGTIHGIKLLECNLPLPVLVSCANFCWNMKERVSGAVLASPILSNRDQLHDLVVYGLPMVHPNSTLVVTINGTRTAIEIVYLSLFIIFYHEKKKRARVALIIMVELIFIAVVATLVLVIAHTTERRSMVVGIIDILFNSMMYASPLLVMKLVVTTKSVEYMPFSLLLASFANVAA
ncbi:hypothetical protein V6N13_125146 [Hibiscus sabdariffa]